MMCINVTPQSIRTSLELSPACFLRLSSNLQHVYYVTKVISTMFPTPLKWFPACFLSLKRSQACVLRLSSDIQHVPCVSQAIFNMLKQITIPFTLLTHSMCATVSTQNIILDCITQHYTVRSSAYEMWCRSAVEPHWCVPGWHRAVTLVVQYQGLEKKHECPSSRQEYVKSEKWLVM